MHPALGLGFREFVQGFGLEGCLELVLATSLSQVSGLNPKLKLSSGVGDF